MPEAGRYYLGRVIKLGGLTSEGLRQAIESPVVWKQKEYMFTFTDIRTREDLPAGGYVYGRLTKYRPSGEVEVVVPEQHVAAIADIPNLLYASSSFIYLPEYSGIAYQHVWNRLRYEQFERIFAILIREYFDAMFVDASIEPVADLRTFIQRMSTLDSVTDVEATVHPPNPLFGPLWDDLRQYMKGRNIGELKVAEASNTIDGLNTNIPRLARQALERSELPPMIAREILGAVQPGIADAAVLMAADGYGRATVKGRSGQSTLTFRTSQSHISFNFPGEPDPDALYEEARAILARISEERYLEHPK
jgi:hypothetical protein